MIQRKITSEAEEMDYLYIMVLRCWKLNFFTDLGNYYFAIFFSRISVLLELLYDTVNL
ncbi:hypothetical protein L873DRAFT_1809625 [Choiromyces venosus 120613-1]|uniref:Uncharacterized protein n=1 Tax=Choiromyces venosus 120613-1 TaxID=1336337 RepID=A0A3N4JH13_9PEZI|nr:hypothetical protein L873DRAFT_1809625 [Choiromyces venosus 120613-1]